MQADAYAFVKLTDRERAACESAYRFAMKITRSKEFARQCADRAVFIEAQRERRERNARLDRQGQR